MAVENKQNISGIKFPGNDTIFVLQAETTNDFSEANNLVATNVQGVNAAIKKAKDEISKIDNAQNSRLKKLESSGAMHFIGAESSIPKDTTRFQPGDVILVGNKEYILNKENNFIEFGDTTVEVQDLTTLKEEMSIVQGTEDQEGSIKKALSDAKNYANNLNSSVMQTLSSKVEIEQFTTLSNTVDNNSNSIKSLNTSLGNKADKSSLTSKADTSSVLLLSGTQAMTGSLNMNSHNISYVTDPIQNQDAATKNYVDTKLKNNIIFYENKTAKFEENSLSKDFPFKGTISIAGITANDYPIVNFSIDQASAGIYSSVAESNIGKIYIYASENPPGGAIQIPSIIIFKGGILGNG